MVDGVDSAHWSSRTPRVNNAVLPRYWKLQLISIFEQKAKQVVLNEQNKPHATKAVLHGHPIRERQYPTTDTVVFRRRGSESDGISTKRSNRVDIHPCQKTLAELGFQLLLIATMTSNSLGEGAANEDQLFCRSFSSQTGYTD